MGVPVTNLAWVMKSGGAPLVQVERAVGEPGPGQVLVRVRATSLNFHDVVNLMGLIEGPWPRVPMSDGAGEVVAVGPDVSGLTVGDRVVGAFYPLWLDGQPTRENKRQTPGDSCDGWLQQYRVCDETELVRAPTSLTDLEAATLPCAGVAAWRALQEAGVGPGDTVVTLGTGGVSSFAVQFANALGATVISTSSSDDKLRVAAELGATYLLNYRTTPEWHAEVRKLTGGRGADAVLDVGGAETLPKSLRAVRIGGTVIILGLLSGYERPEVAIADILVRHLRLIGVAAGSVADTAELVAFVERHDLHPHVSHTFRWDELSTAVEVANAGRHVGKIALDVP